VPNARQDQLWLFEAHGQNIVRIDNYQSFLVAKFRSSLEAVKDAIKLNPNNPEVHYIMGKISIALNDEENSLIHLKTSIAKEENEAAYL
jgi:hypothetical protein